MGPDRRSVSAVGSNCEEGFGFCSRFIRQWLKVLAKQHRRKVLKRPSVMMLFLWLRFSGCTKLKLLLKRSQPLLMVLIAICAQGKVSIFRHRLPCGGRELVSIYQMLTSNHLEHTTYGPVWLASPSSNPPAAMIASGVSTSWIAAFPISTSITSGSKASNICRAPKSPFNVVSLS